MKILTTPLNNCRIVSSTWEIRLKILFKGLWGVLGLPLYVKVRALICNSIWFRFLCFLKRLHQHEPALGHVESNRTWNRICARKGYYNWRMNRISIKEPLLRMYCRNWCLQIGVPFQTILPSAEVPCVNESGINWPCDSIWSLSPPMVLEAFNPSSISPYSKISLALSALYAQTPERQPAWIST